jgi:D-inositol-3-phosphate glycosyltransferase
VATDAVAAPDATLVVVGGPSPGPGPYRDGPALLELARSLGVADRVRIVTPRPHSDLAATYSAADVLLMPSRSESFGMVALEAQACGVPVVGSRAGGLRHVVADGDSGVLVEGWDPADYAQQVARVLTEPGLAERLGRGGVRQAALFSWDATADRLLGVYREIRPDIFSE